MSDKDILDDLRERYSYATSEWADVRREAALDMKYIAGDPWSAKDRKQREDAGRPCLSLDELGQYVNQVINDLLQNKRGIKVTPVGFGANDQTASFRQGRIRDIEYRSNAQQAYTMMAENAIQRSYGYLRIASKYASQTKGFDKDLLIEPILNPDLVTPDPDFLRPDGADWKYLFFEESRSVSEFKREFPGARKQSFSVEDSAVASDWYQANRIKLAEYWAKEIGKRRKLLLLKPPPPTPQNPQPQPIEVFKDELQQMPSSEQIIEDREIDEYRVTSYLTNGFEILRKTPWKGASIPFVGCYGKIIYVNGKRVILSMVRLARDPYMAYCHARTSEVELIGMTPKFPYFYYDGQLTPESLILLAKSLHEPVAGIPVNVTVPGAPPGAVLPPPGRQPYEPAIQALELAAESFRRAIQAAIGVMFLPTSAQRQNEKSGKALKQIESTAQKGAYHFVDHYDSGIMRTGALLDEQIPHFDDTAKEVSIRKPDDSVEQVRINDRQAEKFVEVNKDHRHDVTISVGPAFESERDAASDFADTILGSKEILAVIGPQKAAELASLAIKLKGVGPLGDQMAEIISPKDKNADPHQTQQELAQCKAKLQEVMQIAQKLQEDIKTDKVKIDGQIHIKELDLAFQREKLAIESETKLGVAELSAKVDKLALFLEERERLGVADGAEHDRSHEVGMSAMEHEQALEAGQQAHQQASDAAEQAAGHASDAAVQQAALQPPPAEGASA